MLVLGTSKSLASQPEVEERHQLSGATWLSNGEVPGSESHRPKTAESLLLSNRCTCDTDDQ